MTYRIRQSSLGLFAIVLVTVGAISMEICLFLLRSIQNQQIAYILSLGVLFSLLIYIPRLLSSGDTEIILTDNGLEHNWVRQLIFQHRPAISIRWNEIEDYVFEPHRQFDQFKLHLKDGSQFKMFHNHDHDKDDFKKFLQDFVQKIQELNDQAQDQSALIQEGRKTYTWQTWVLGSWAVCLTIFFPTMFITHPKTAMTFHKWAFLIGVYLLGMFILLASIWKLKKQRP